MACGTGVQPMVSGELTIACAGEVICGLPWLEQFVDGATVNVRVAEVREVQPVPPWATTYQVVVPLPMLMVSEVCDVEPARVSTPSVEVQTSYEAAPVTDDQESATGEATVTPFTGESSDVAADEIGRAHV